MNRLQQLLHDAKLEDSTAYLEIMKHINTNKLEGYAVRSYITAFTKPEVEAIGKKHLELLLSLHYRNYSTVYVYTHNSPEPIHIYINTHNIQRQGIGHSDVNALSQEDLIYLPDYMRTKWKQANPTTTTRKTRGTGFTFKMDMFSLTIFKSNSTKKFLRTEAKNLILSVNKAFNESPKELSHIKIRNKYYYVILENTDHLTKAALNSLLATRLTSNHQAPYSFYDLESDEAIAIDMYATKELMSYCPTDCMDTYSTDTAVVTSNLGYEGYRDNERVLGAISALTTVYARTANKAYLDLALRTAKYLPSDVKQNALVATQSIIEFRNTLKDNT